jgi:pimeloyl-ACP methyl ester carboxylesterase
MPQARTVQVDDAVLTVHDAGHGAPLLLVQTALSAEELVPLGRHPLLAPAHRVLDVRRRGYAVPAPGSASGGAGGVAGSAPGSVLLDSDDCARVLEALRATPAHVLGTSYSAAVALELATRRPELVRTLTLVEPPPSNVAAGEDFRAANRALLRTYAAQGVTSALEEFTRILHARSWLEERSTADPALVARVEHDAGVFFTRDVPALLAWRYDSGDARLVTAPVLYIGGEQSPAWFQQVHRWVHELFPHAEHHILAGAGHALVSTHTDEVARLVASFVTRVAG